MVSVIENEAAIKAAFRARQRTQLAGLIAKMSDTSIACFLSQITLAPHFRCQLHDEAVWRRLLCEPNFRLL